MGKVQSSYKVLNSKYFPLYFILGSYLLMSFFFANSVPKERIAKTQEIPVALLPKVLTREYSTVKEQRWEQQRAAKRLADGATQEMVTMEGINRDKLMTPIFKNKYTGLMQTKWQSLLFGECVPQKMPKYEMDIPMVMVTAASESYFGHLQNFVGAIHTWDPQLHVIIYDIGLGADQLSQVANWCGVTLERFPFDEYPSTTQNLKAFAWKSIVVKLALEKYGKIQYFDSGYEMRQPIDYVRSRVDRGTYFCTGMGDTLTRGSRPGQYRKFHTSQEDMLGRPMTAGGVQGCSMYSGCLKYIIEPAVACSSDTSCITAEAPPGEKRSFSKDQSIFSINIYNNTAFTTIPDPAFTIYYGLEVDKFTKGRWVMYHKRSGGTYNGDIITKDSIKCISNTTDPALKWQAELQKGLLPLALADVESRKEQCGLLGMVPEAPPSKLPTVLSFPKFPEERLVIVTGADHSQFENLKNLVGSVTRHEPLLKIVVYDIGLTEQQASAVKSWCNVQYERFNFGQYPDHVATASNHAWKFIAMKQTLKDYLEILYLDPGQELRSTIEDLVFMLRRDGYFQGGREVQPLFIDYVSDLINYYKEDKWHFMYKPLCSSVMVGFTKNGGAAERVLLPAYQCALDDKCWAQGQSKNYQDYFGTVLSFMVYNNTGYNCNWDFDFFVEYDNIPMWAQSLRSEEDARYEEDKPAVVFYRGEGTPKLFSKYVTSSC